MLAPVKLKGHRHEHLPFPKLIISLPSRQISSFKFMGFGLGIVLRKTYFHWISRVKPRKRRFGKKQVKKATIYRENDLEEICF